MGSRLRTAVPETLPDSRWSEAVWARTRVNRRRSMPASAHHVERHYHHCEMMKPNRLIRFCCYGFIATPPVPAAFLFLSRAVFPERVARHQGRRAGFGPHDQVDRLRPAITSRRNSCKRRTWPHGDGPHDDDGGCVSAPARPRSWRRTVTIPRAAISPHREPCG